MMDKSNLIDLNNDKCYKIPSPLIPPPKSSGIRLSIIDNNPFDKVLKIIANKDDPFEYNPDLSNTNKIRINSKDEENKENIGHLISPIQTPVKLKRHKKLTPNPLYISSNSGDNQNACSSQLPLISEAHNLSVDFNVTDTSLQILSESFLNNVEGDMSNSFMVACNLPLPNSPDEDISKINEKSHGDIPCISINDESKNSVLNCTNNALNNGFIDTLSSDNLKKRLSTTSAMGSKCSFNPNSFHSGSLGSTEISDILNVSNTTSKENSNFNQLDNAFIEDKNSHRIASTNLFSEREKVKFNNSFGGFNNTDRKLTYAKGSHIENIDDSVFLEAIKLADLFHKSAMAMNVEFEDENISECPPPWLEEDIVFVDVDENHIDDKEASIKTSTKIDVQNEEVESNKNTENNYQSFESTYELQKKETITVTINETHEEKPESPQNNEANNPELKNAKDLLNNLTAILNNSGTARVDQRKLGESLINSLALALNIENPIVNSNNEQKHSINKLQRSKSDSGVSGKRKSVEKQGNKLTVPKLKTQPPAPVDKNLKVRNEKEKITGKGPLKAFIPLTIMAKNKKGINQKEKLATTPPKQFLQTSKKTSTPNDHKMKPPIAQSTPEVSKLQGMNVNSTSPLSKKHFGFSDSPLSRTANTNDISNVYLNSSLSPNASGSIPNLNKSNSKLPTIKYISRRNSASDMSTSRSNSLNRSYDNTQSSHPPIQLKRSSSFQNKSTTVTQKSNAGNSNTVKKYGMPGTLKSLKLVPKDKKINKN